jgi:ribosomal protein L29
MKFKELQSMSKEDLGEKLKQLRMDLIKSNAQVATGTTPKNSGQIKVTKKTIAKIKTILATKTEEKKE